ncbi:MAG: tetratricopeptide repeat protein [Myxococcaceae bacterium]
MRSSVLVLASLLAASAAGAEPLVGPSVGNADVLLSEGSKLYNRKQPAKAADAFLKATRANPAAVQAYLQLARSHLAAKQLMRACYEYRAYLKAASESPERKKAQGESELCERQLKGAKGQPPDPAPRYVELRAAFFAALEKKELLGPSSASEALRSLVTEGFVGTELGDMASKLHAAALEAAGALHARALAREAVTTDALKTVRPLYQLCADVGPAPAEAAARSAFLDGLAAFQGGDYTQAEALFAEASKAEPAAKEYRYYRAMALFRGGDRKAALDAMEADLPDDPRTAVLRVALALGTSPETGAAELERLLFTKRYPPARQGP